MSSELRRGYGNGVTVHLTLRVVLSLVVRLGAVSKGNHRLGWKSRAAARGVSALVRVGIADPNRVAHAGQSWGGYLAAYGLTHTDIFRTVIVHEAVNLSLMGSRFGTVANPESEAFARQLGIAGSPCENEEHLRDLSPVYQVAYATTPTLLEFGENSLIKDGNELFQRLTHFHEPAKLINYSRTGHGIEEPALLEDTAKRDLEWFAYWVLGKPTQRMLNIVTKHADGSSQTPAPKR